VLIGKRILYEGTLDYDVIPIALVGESQVLFSIA
jgi:hypothetical protein